MVHLDLSALSPLFMLSQFSFTYLRQRLGFADVPRVPGVIFILHVLISSDRCSPPSQEQYG